MSHDNEFEFQKGVPASVSQVRGGINSRGDLMVALLVEENTSGNFHHFIIDLDNARTLQKVLKLLDKQLNPKDDDKGDIVCN